MSKKHFDLLMKHLVILFSVIIIIHFSIITYFINERIKFSEIKHKSNAKMIIIDALINASHSPDNLAKIIDIINKYGLKSKYFSIKLSIDNKPLYTTRIKSTTNTNNKDMIYHANSKNSYLKFSYQITDNKWLNYQEVPIYYLFKASGILVAIEIGIIFIIILYGWAVTRYSIPLRHFKYSAERLGIDINTHSALPTTGSFIVHETNEAILKMQNRIQDLINSRTKMLAAISHDLRTPLTRMRLRAELMPDNDYLNKMILDLEEMENMIKGILNFASNDMAREKKTKLDIFSLLTTICNDYIEIQKDMTYEIPQTTVMLLGKAIALKRVFNNIIGNAYKFATQVRLESRVVDNSVITIIKDNGPGIPDHELKNIFKAYYKSSATLAKNHSGSGLGLTISNEIIQQHQGSITLANHGSGGLEVTVSLPLA